jgi:RNase P/RNase MRP subunit p30
MSFKVSIIIALSALPSLQNLRKKRSALKILKNLDFNDSKATAYTFSRYASVLVNDDNIANFEKINTALLAYKYKEKVEQLEQGLIGKIKEFLCV